MVVVRDAVRVARVHREHERKPSITLSVFSTFESISIVKWVQRRYENAMSSEDLILRRFGSDEFYRLEIGR